MAWQTKYYTLRASFDEEDRMPTYRFLCAKCGKTVEEMCKITIKPNEYPACPECGNKMDKIWINAEGGFVLKGGGWFKSGGY